MRKYSDREELPPQQPDQALTEVMLGECERKKVHPGWSYSPDITEKGRSGEKQKAQA